MSYIVDLEAKNRNCSINTPSKNKHKIYSTGKKVKDPINFFHLVAGTCPTNNPTNSNQFEFVGLAAGIKRCSLRLHSLTEVGSHTKGLGPRD